MTWQEMEQTVEQLLIDNNIVYQREGALRTYGHKAGKGKSDFKLEGCKYSMIECKCVQTLTKATFPRPTIKQPLIKTHQLKNLRQHNGGILLYDNESESYYWILPTDIDNIIIQSGLVRSLKGSVSHLKTDLDTLAQQLKQKP